MKYAILGLAMLAAAGVAGANPVLDLSTGYQSARLKWSIAGDSSGCCPNILSELTWRDLQALQLRGELGYRVRGGFHVRGALGYGLILDGENQDSDYAGDNRTGEFSRSNNASDGDDLRDASLHAEYVFTYRDPVVGGVSRIVPMLGHSYHEQNLRMTDGVQTIPDDGPFDGLDSTYQTQWWGPWLGLRLESAADRHNVIEIGLEQHWADFYAVANWNLRSTFAHPESFEHEASGRGRVLTLGYRHRTRRAFDFLFKYRIESWETGAGRDLVHFSDGSQGETRLNEVTFRAWSFNFGISRAF